ncbi:MAG: folate family ECF transporter S component [Oscillospiraceae bacterium]|nr:folate family ECF transporter S component [Oscillospiraceae bacterium]
MKNMSIVRPGVNGKISVLMIVLIGLLAAMSIVFGKLLAINIGTTIRISVENLPILMAGIFLGAPAGFLTGVLADVIGCMIVGYSINPIITLAAGCIGLLAGLMYRVLVNQNLSVRVYGSVMTAHVIGSMILKSAGMMLFYHTPLIGVAPRVPLYLGIGAVEGAIILLLLKNQAFAAQVERLNQK